MSSITATVESSMTSASAVTEQVRAALARRCNCSPCVTPVFVGFAPETLQKQFRACGLIHHDQRRKYHERLWPHELERRARSDRRLSSRAPHSETLGAISPEGAGVTNGNAAQEVGSEPDQAS